VMCDFNECPMNIMRRAALAAMERDLEKRAEQALITVTLSTATLNEVVGRSGGSPWTEQNASLPV
jgi:hypothetical protein